MTSPSDQTPTQVAHPWKATLRTVAAAVVAGLGLFTVAVPIVNEQLGDYLPDTWEAWLAGAVAFLAALSGAVTRIMALERAQTFLTLLGLGTGQDDV